MMRWFMAVMGALLGLALGGGGKALLGFGLGAMLGWQWARLGELRAELQELEERLVRLQARFSGPPAAKAGDEVRIAAMATGQKPGQTPPDAPEPTAVVPASSSRPASVAPAETPAIREPESVTTVPEPLPPRSTALPPAWSSARFEPPRTHAVDRTVQWARTAFFNGNVPVKIGLLVLLFGVAAALKYAVDAGWLHAPLALRLALLAGAGLALVAWGWGNRRVRPAFGLSLQGGGIGIMLLTIFAAYRLYQLLPAGSAFGLVLVLVAGAAALAVLQDSMALAVLGFLGGYLAPVLLSTGAGSHVALFSFYAVLNLAVFVIAWLRHWRVLNLVGFAFTFAIGLAWGAQYYRPEHFATVEPFLLGFFLFYVAIVVLHAVRAPQDRRGVVDGSLLFGTPLLAFGLQAAMLHAQPMALAFSAMAVALLYMGLAFALLRRYPLLGQSFGVLAVGFATLAVPLAFSARATSTVWALEGAALVWLGLRQRRGMPQLIGIGLHLLAAVAWLIHVFDGGWRAQADEWLILNGHALGVLLLALSAFSISGLYERAGRGRGWVWPGFIVGTGWWLWAGLREIEQNASPLLLGRTTGMNVSGWVGFAALSLLVMGVTRRWLHWPRPGWNVLLALLLSLPLAAWTDAHTPSALHWPLLGCWLAWLVAAWLGLASLRQPRQRGLAVAHLAFLATLALAAGLALDEAAGRAGLGRDWRYLAGFLPLLGLVFATWHWPRVGAFSLASEFPGHARVWFVLAGLVFALAWFESLWLPGDGAPLAYLPLINPLELAQLAGLVLAIRLMRTGTDRAWLPLVALAGFIWLNFTGLRAVHHHTGLPWSPALLDHGVSQATITLLWAVAGVLCWVLGSRRRSWGLWLVGAIAMGVVLAKLVLVDRQYVGNLAGIVSFMAVGALLVLVGRIAPTPPRAQEHEP